MGGQRRSYEESSPLVLTSMFNRVVPIVCRIVSVRNTKYKSTYKSTCTTCTCTYLYLYLYGQPVRITHPSKDRETRDYVRYRIRTRKRGTQYYLLFIFIIFYTYRRKNESSTAQYVLVLCTSSLLTVLNPTNPTQRNTSSLHFCLSQEGGSSRTTKILKKSHCLASV